MTIIVSSFGNKMLFGLKKIDINVKEIPVFNYKSYGLVLISMSIAKLYSGVLIDLS
ncbi:hypothetical protein ABEW05_006652 [Botrytis cinerea]